VKPRRIGALRHRVTIETETRLPDGGGGALVAWTPVADLWAAVVPISGTEPVVAEASVGRITHAVTLRWRADLTPAMRVRLVGRILSLVAVLDVDERRRFLRCLCREEAS
jgi:SPP1 family predicted phage head-tail adaptor